MSIQKTSLQKLYELAVGTQSYTIEFTARNRQLDWLEISLVYDKSNQHKMVCDNYSAELVLQPCKTSR